MAAVVIFSPPSSVVPGGEAVGRVTIRNTGAVVDAFTVDVLGPATGWATVVPPSISLFPGAEGTVDLHFRPPRAAGLPAGTLDIAVRVVPSQDPDGAVVEEGSLHVEAFVDVVGRLTPRTSEAKRTGHHEVLLDNRGNGAVEIEVSAIDPDEHLAFDIKPHLLSVGPGESGQVAIKAGARKGFLRGPPKTHPFQVLAQPSGQSQIVLDGALAQKAGLPRWVVPVAAAVIAIALIAALLPRGLGGTISLATAGRSAGDNAGAGEEGDDEGGGGEEATEEETSVDTETADEGGEEREDGDLAAGDDLGGLTTSGDRSSGSGSGGGADPDEPASGGGSTSSGGVAPSAGPTTTKPPTAGATTTAAPTPTTAAPTTTASPPTTAPPPVKKATCTSGDYTGDWGNDGSGGRRISSFSMALTPFSKTGSVSVTIVLDGSSFSSSTTTARMNDDCSDSVAFTAGGTTTTIRFDVMTDGRMKLLPPPCDFCRSASAENFKRVRA